MFREAGKEKEVLKRSTVNTGKELFNTVPVTPGAWA